MSSGDSIVDSVVQKFTERSRLGQVKYGKTLDRGDLTVHEWITHAQEELMDGILYLEKLRQVVATCELRKPDDAAVVE
jgi:hypothetical protein